MLLLLAGVLQAAFYYPRLPDTVASHFGGSGKADGFSSKTSFFAITLGSLLGDGLLFLVIGCALPFIPSRFINVPRREYWLAPERRRATVDRVAAWLLWFGVLTTLLLIFVVQLAIEANLDGSSTLSPWFFVLLVLYLGLTVVWLIHLLRSFRLPPEAALTGGATGHDG